MRHILMLFVVLVPMLHPSSGAAQGASAGAWGALGDGLRDLGAQLQERRDREEALEIERMRAEGDRELAAALAALAAAEAAAIQSPPSVRSEAEERAYRALDLLLAEEYQATETFIRALHNHTLILENLGEEAAATYWKGVTADAQDFIVQRRRELLSTP